MGARFEDILFTYGHVLIERVVLITSFNALICGVILVITRFHLVIGAVVM